MSIFDRFTSKSRVPKGYVEVKVEFTDEESAAINASMDGYASLWAAQFDGQGFVTPEKVVKWMEATALTEYAAELVTLVSDCESDEEIALRMKKALQSQAKAYAMCNLPVHLFQLAGMYEIAGDKSQAAKFFGLFLRAQDEFTPDPIDNVLLNINGFDMERSWDRAKRKLDNSSPNRASPRFVVIPVTSGKRQRVAAQILDLLRISVDEYGPESFSALQGESAWLWFFKCICYALLLSVSEVVINEKYVSDDASDIIVRTSSGFFDGREDRSTISFQDFFKQARAAYQEVPNLVVPMFNLTERQMYERWAKVFVNELDQCAEVLSEERNVEIWAFELLLTFRRGCSLI